MTRASALPVGLARLLVVAGLILAWEVVVRMWGDPMFVASPSQVLVMIRQLLADPAVMAALGVALVQIVIAFVLAGSIGTVIGIALGSSPLMRASILQIVFVCYALPQSVFMPLFILFAGIGPEAKVAYGFTHGVFAVILAVSAGVQNIDPLLLKAARSMGASREQILTSIVLPHLVPSLFTALRLCMTGVILGVLLAELYVSLHGIGHFTRRATETFDPPRLFALVSLLAAMAVMLNGLCRIAEARFSRWHH